VLREEVEEQAELMESARMGAYGRLWYPGEGGGVGVASGVEA
jgi:hypothetical protein